jgi:hypothetical protein
MATRIITLPHTTPPSRIVYENNFENVLGAIMKGSDRMIAEVGQHVVDRAQDTGDYQNRTGNLRRMITSNVDRAGDDPRSYTSTEVEVVEADGKKHKRKQYRPPQDFDDTVVMDRGDESVVTVAAIMHYAAPREARGNNVLSHAVYEIVTNARSVMQRTFRITAADLTDWRTKIERLSGVLRRSPRNI